MSNPIEQRLEAIALRERVATKGPWDCTHYDMETALISVHIDAEHICFVPVVETAEKPPNGKFIAHARQDVPFLLALVKRYRDAIPFPELTRTNAEAMAWHWETHGVIGLTEKAQAEWLRGLCRNLKAFEDALNFNPDAGKTK